MTGSNQGWIITSTKEIMVLLYVSMFCKQFKKTTWWTTMEILPDVGIGPNYIQINFGGDLDQDLDPDLDPWHYHL